MANSQYLPKHQERNENNNNQGHEIHKQTLPQIDELVSNIPIH